MPTGDSTGGVTERGPRALWASGTGSWGRVGCAAAEDRGGVAPRGARRHLQEKPALPTELHAHVAQDVEEPVAEVPGG